MFWLNHSLSSTSLSYISLFSGDPPYGGRGALPSLFLTFLPHWQNVSFMYLYICPLAWEKSSGQKFCFIPPNQAVTFGGITAVLGSRCSCRDWAPLSPHEHLVPSTAVIPPKVIAYFGGMKKNLEPEFFSPARVNIKIHFAKKNLKLGRSSCRSKVPPYEVTTTN